MEVLVTSLLLAGLHVTSQVEGVEVDVASHLMHLTTHRYPNMEHKEARERTLAYITERFEEYGLRVDHQGLSAFASPDPTNPFLCPDPSYNVQGACTVSGVNVIGVSGPEREEAGAVVVVGAAYDTSGVGSPLYDNGAGLAVLLEVARVYQSSVSRPRLSTLFVAFDLSVESYYVTKEGRNEEGKVDEDDGSVIGAREEQQHSEDRRREGGGGDGGGERRSSGGGLPGGWSLVQDYLRSYLKQNTSCFGGAIVLGPLMNVNHRDHSQGLDDRLQELFPGAQEQVAAGGHRGDFVAMVTKGGDEDEVALNLGRRLTESYREMGGRLVEFNLGNRSHSLLPPSLPTRQAAHFWDSTRRGRAAPLPAVLLTDTEEYRQWPPDTPGPSYRLTGEQRAFLHTTVTSLAHFLVWRDPQQGQTDWLVVGLLTTLVASWIINGLLLLHLWRLCASSRKGKPKEADHCSAEVLISRGVKYRPEDSN